MWASTAVEDRRKEKRNKPIKSFGGKGVWAGDAPLTHETTFTGWKKKLASVKTNFRCLNCFTVQSSENKQCWKCKTQRELTEKEEEEETEKKEIEEKQFEEESDELEDKREWVLDTLSELEVETNEFFKYTIKKIRIILGNIIMKPEEEKFRTLKLAN